MRWRGDRPNVLPGPAGAPVPGILQARTLEWVATFRMDWLDLLAVRGTLKSLHQHHSSKASILRRSAFFIVHRAIQLQLLQHYWSGHRLGLLCY